MAADRIVISGIPIDNVTMGETMDLIFAMIDNFSKNRKPGYVAIVNVDFIVNTLAWSLSYIRHPELLKILRTSELVLAEGMPMVWTSALMGTRLKDREPGLKLIPRLAEEAAGRKKSIYFLGCQNNVGKMAASDLKRRNPDLIIAGTDSSLVDFEGEALADSPEKDAPIVERINSSGADILVIGFGNPRQEAWFERNRSRLKVPVSIGVGGTYEFITGPASGGAPLWMQKAGLEWAFRITQGANLLIRLYFVSLFKFGLMILPAIFYYNYRRLLHNISRSRYAINANDILLSDQCDNLPIRKITLPETLDKKTVRLTKDEIQRHIAKNSTMVLDFGNVTVIDSAGLGLLFSLIDLEEKRRIKIYLIGINQSTQRFFELNRVADIVKDKIYHDISELATLVKEPTAMQQAFYSFETVGLAFLRLRLSGVLDAAQMANLDIDRILEEIGDRNCIINLTDLSFIDSSGLIFFLKIKRHVSNRNRACILFAPKENVLQMFRITKIDRLFRIRQ